MSQTTKRIRAVGPRTAPRRAGQREDASLKGKKLGKDGWEEEKSIENQRT